MAKIGEDHVKEMFKRGLAEIQSASYFETSIAQPNPYTVTRSQERRDLTLIVEQTKAPSRGPDQAPELEIER